LGKILEFPSYLSPIIFLTMRIIPFAISTVVTAALVFALNKPWGAIPPMGKFLSPQHGFWQNAESSNKNYSASLKFDELKGKAEVYFDERLVPHVFAENDEDLYFIQVVPVKLLEAKPFNTTENKEDWEWYLPLKMLCMKLKKTHKPKHYFRHIPMALMPILLH